MATYIIFSDEFGMIYRMHVTTGETFRLMNNRWVRVLEE